MLGGEFSINDDARRPEQNACVRVRLGDLQDQATRREWQRTLIEEASEANHEVILGA